VTRPEELRLIAKVASLYYEHNLRQVDIANQLDLSQAKVSRLLKRALEEKIVRITVSGPRGSHPDLEYTIQQAYGLKDVIVVDAGADEDELLHNLGSAGAYYLETTIKDGECIGISSWSETLLAVANAMTVLDSSIKAHVVQILGGVGNPNAAFHAAQLTRRMAQLVNGDAMVLPAPGVVGLEETRNILLSDPFVAQAVDRFDHITLALVGIGSVAPSRLLASSGNVFSQEELDQLRKAGAVGDICLRFINKDGKPVSTPLENRVIGMSLEQLKRVNRAVGIAGGMRKISAIRGALKGCWISVLVTDQLVAQELVRSANNNR
jgi:DNA-binding transcriptional regulator LsrR (DeoR family)